MTKPKTGTRAEWLGAAVSFLGMGVVMMVARMLRPWSQGCGATASPVR